MRGADEDEGGDDDVEDGVVGYEHENAVSVGCQPDVVLRDEQLKQNTHAHIEAYVITRNQNTQSSALQRKMQQK